MRRKEKRTTIHPKRYKLYIRFTALLLVFSLVFTSAPWSELSVLAEASEISVVSIAREMEEYRSEYSKTYLRTDGTLESIVSTQPLHYRKTANDSWENINVSLQWDELKQKYTSTSAPYDISFPSELSETTGFTVTENNHSIAFELIGSKKSKGKSLEKKKEKVSRDKRKKMTASEIASEDLYLTSGIVYNDVYSNTDIQYDIDATSVKESIILNKKPNKHTIYEYRINTDLFAVLNDDGSIDFYDEADTSQKNRIFHMPAPYMFDSSDNLSYDVKTKLSVTENGYVLAYQPDYMWLKSKDRVYPVTIDPTVVADTSLLDTYTYSAPEKADTYLGYEQQLKVGSTNWLTACDYFETYLHFAELPEIPAEEFRIDSAYLMLTPKSAVGAWEEMEVGAYRITEEWHTHNTGSTTQRITANNAPHTENYASATALFSKENLDNNTAGFEIAHLVQDWYEDPETNYGIKLSAHLDENQYNDTLVFYSSRSTVGQIPYLTITHTYLTYEPVTEIVINNRPENDQLIYTDSGRTHVFGAAVYPTYATNTDLIWSSSNHNVAYFDEADSSDLYCSAPGTTTITATSVSDPEIYDSFELEVLFVPVEEIVISNYPENNTLYVGDVWAPIVQVEPLNSSYAETINTHITWESTNESVASLNESGIFTARQEGTTTITATHDNCVTSFVLTVCQYPIESLSIVGLPENNTIEYGEKWDLDVLISPDDADFSSSVYEHIVWSSSDNTVAYVDENGIVYAAKHGTVVITATYGTYSDSCIITVPYVPIESVTILNSSGSEVLREGSNFEIEILTLPTNASAPDIVMVSDNENVVTVSDHCAVMVGIGTATVSIIALHTGIVHNTITFTVLSSDIVINRPSNNQLYIGESWQLEKEEYLEIAEIETDIISFDGDGWITAKKPGTVCLEVYHVLDRSYFATYYLRIAAKGMSIICLPTKIGLGETVEGGWVSFDTDVNFDFADVIWSSSNPEIISVSADFLNGACVSALSEGTARIYAYIPHMNAKAYLDITVGYIDATAINIKAVNGSTAPTLYLGDNVQMAGVVTPTYATYNTQFKYLDWYTSNDKLSYEVKHYRKVRFYAQKVGTCQIYAKGDGLTSNKVNVTVKAFTATINNRPAADTMYVDQTLTLSYTSKPSGATAEWKSSNTNVATINATTGKIQAKTAGTTTISLIAVNGSMRLTVSFTLTVSNPGVWIDGYDSTEPTVGDTFQLTAEVISYNGVDQSVEWSSSDTSIATISQNGAFVAFREGIVVITARSKKYNECYSNCVFTVKKLKIYQTEKTFRKNEDGEIPEDLLCNTLTDEEIKGKSWANPTDFVNTTASDHEFNWRYMCSALFSTESLEDVAFDMFDHFMAGSGDDYRNPILTDAAYNHVSTQEYISNVMQEIDKLMDTYDGDITALRYYAETRKSNPLIVNMVKEEIKEPLFNNTGDIYNGLTICVDTLWGNQIEVSSYTVNGNSYSGILKFTLYDHFGLDENDVLKYNALIGFRSWYILQHSKTYDGAYKPFVSIMEFDVPFFGTFS